MDHSRVNQLEVSDASRLDQLEASLAHLHQSPAIVNTLSNTPPPVQPGFMCPPGAPPPGNHIQGFAELQSDIFVYDPVVKSLKPVRTRLPDRQHSKAKPNNRRAPIDKSLQCAACHSLGHLAVDCIALARGIWMAKYTKDNKGVCVQVQKAWKDKKDAERSAVVAKAYMDATDIGVEQMYDEIDVDSEDVFGTSESL